MGWIGAAVIEPGRLIYRGELGGAHGHSHAAVQVAVASRGAMAFTDATGQRAEGEAGVIPSGVVHPSVRRAIEVLPTLLDGPARLTDVARTVHLSPDRLGRLFARDVGLSFSAYVRWTRLMRAMEVARGGGTFTDAAHAAGFTDSSHANRVFHEMFGIAPIVAHRGVRLD